MEIRTRVEQTGDGRDLCVASFEIWPERADTPTVEVIYEFYRPAEDHFSLEGDPVFLERLSSTRTDTREDTHLPQTDEEVRRAVVLKIAEQFGPF